VQVSTRTGHDAGYQPRARTELGGLVLAAAGGKNTPRWQPGDRLERLYEARCDWLREQGRSGHLAVDAGDVRLTYADLDARANQLARFLLRQGVQPGDRIGLLLDGAVDSYTAMLAVLKARPPTCRSTRPFPRTGWRSSRPTPACG
jgi:non-ribosomal peptide synthetase component F